MAMLEAVIGGRGGAEIVIALVEKTGGFRGHPPRVEGVKHADGTTVIHHPRIGIMIGDTDHQHPVVVLRDRSSRSRLTTRGGGIEQAFRESVEACLPPGTVDGTTSGAAH